MSTVDDTKTFTVKVGQPPQPPIEPWKLALAILAVFGGGASAYYGLRGKKK